MLVASRVERVDSSLPALICPFWTALGAQGQILHLFGKLGNLLVILGKHSFLGDVSYPPT